MINKVNDFKVLRDSKIVHLIYITKMRDNHIKLTYSPPPHEELKSPGPLGILNSGEEAL